MSLSRKENIARQEALADELAKIQDQIENPQTEEECDPSYRDVVLLPQRDEYQRELDKLQEDLNDNRD